MKPIQKIVVKIGTSTLTQGAQKLSRRYMLDLARQLSELHEKGKQVILVTSGAVAAGRDLLQSAATLPHAKQMFAAIGQVQLMQAWTELFQLFDIHVGQLLLTREDFSHRNRYLNARDTLSCLLQHQVIPVVNENDTVAVAETKVGDNDNLAALIANLIGADLLILLTDQEGLYTADPRQNPGVTLITTVKDIDETIFSVAKGSSSSLGTGGMTTKIEAAQVAMQCGIPTVIASASKPNVLLNIAEEKSVGTLFLTDLTYRNSRKRWLLSEKKQGTIQVDAGAASKIIYQGTSLLASGITQTTQPFERGAIVHILSPAQCNMI